MTILPITFCLFVYFYPQFSSMYGYKYKRVKKFSNYTIFSQKNFFLKNKENPQNGFYTFFQSTIFIKQNILFILTELLEHTRHFWVYISHILDEFVVLLYLYVSVDNQIKITTFEGILILRNSRSTSMGST